MPLSELTEVIDDTLGICAEIMWTVVVDQNACPIVMIVGIATNMITSFDDETGFAKLARNSLGKHRTGKTRTDNEEIETHEAGFIE